MGVKGAAQARHSGMRNEQSSLMALVQAIDRKDPAAVAALLEERPELAGASVEAEHGHAQTLRFITLYTDWDHNRFNPDIAN